MVVVTAWPNGRGERHILENLLDALDGDHQTLSFVVGCPSPRALRDFLAPHAESQSPLESSGISGARPASTAKHALNTVVAEACGFAERLVALELGQGVGDGTQVYRKLGLVVAVERKLDLLQVAASRVPHLDIAASGPGDLLLQPLDALRRTLNASNPPAVMFPHAQTTELALRRLTASDWRFNWVDIDPMGFAESAEMEVDQVYPLLDLPAILCITNGGFHAERFHTNMKMRELLCGNTRIATATEKQRQASAMTKELLSVEAAFRIRQAQTRGTSILPLLLYDGRSGNSGIVRSYFVASRHLTKTPHVVYDPYYHLFMLRRDLVRQFSGTDEAWPGELIPRVDIDDFVSSSYYLESLRDAIQGRYSWLISGEK